MPRARALSGDLTLIRPMLEVKREEIVAYLAAIDQPYREDRSNADTRFTRNRIRHELLPMLAREYSPGVVDSLLRLASVGGDAQRLIESLAEEFCEWAVDESDSGFVVDCRALFGKDRHLVREVMIALWRRRGWPMRDMGYVEWNRLADMAASDVASKQVFPGAIVAERSGDRLMLAPADEQETR
jgi:tRNA(Ile)-lysidine synthase